MEPFTQIKETALYVKDLQKTRQFYEGLLGLPVISAVEGRHVFFRAGSSVLLCFNPEATRQDAFLPPHFGAGKLHLAFEVASERYQAAKEGLLAAGISITHEQTWPGGFLSCYFEDPDGHCLEIVQQGMWGN